MLFTRKIGKVLRGKATGPQVIMAAVLAGVLGFLPGSFRQEAGLVLSLVFLVLVLNANLAVFALVGVGAKLVSLPLVGVSFALGQAFLDGPLQPLFRGLVNAPVFAWFGLEHYATTGGLVLGLVLGSIAGIALWRALVAFRGKMASLAEDSAAYQRWSNRRSVKVLTWVFVGGSHGKKTWRELYESERKGSPVRIVGLVVVGLLLVAGFLVQSGLAGPFMRSALQTSLEHWNAATVDVGHAAVDLGAGRVTISGLALANAEDLDKDSFRAHELTMAIDPGELLAKRFVIDEIASREASTGEKRAERARRTREAPEPPPPPPGDGKTLDDYLKEAELWKGRLQKASEWLQVVMGTPEEESPAARTERIERDKELFGVTSVVAHHLLRGAPRLLVRKLTFEGVKAVDLGGELLDVHAKNLSSEPWLVDGALELSLRARSGRFAFTFRADPKTSRSGTTSFVWKDLPVDSLLGQLKLGDKPPLRGGTLDLALDGKLDFTRPAGVWLDVPLVATLHGTTLALPSLTETAIDNLALPIGLRGPLAAPRVTFDDQKLADALVAAGKAELAKQVRERAGAFLGDQAGAAGKAVEDILQGKKPDAAIEEAKQKAAEEAKKAADDLLKKKLPGGLFGEKKEPNKQDD